MKLYEGDLGNKYRIMNISFWICSRVSEAPLQPAKQLKMAHTRRNSRRAHVARDPVIHHASPTRAPPHRSPRTTGGPVRSFRNP